MLFPVFGLPPRAAEETAELWARSDCESDLLEAMLTPPSMLSGVGLGACRGGAVASSRGVIALWSRSVSMGPTSFNLTGWRWRFLCGVAVELFKDRDDLGERAASAPRGNSFDVKVRRRRFKRLQKPPPPVWASFAFFSVPNAKFLKVKIWAIPTAPFVTLTWCRWSKDLHF